MLHIRGKAAPRHLTLVTRSAALTSISALARLRLLLAILTRFLHPQTHPLNLCRPDMFAQVVRVTGLPFLAAISRHQHQVSHIVQALSAKSCRALPGRAPIWPLDLHVWMRRHGLNSCNHLSDLFFLSSFLPFLRCYFSCCLRQPDSAASSILFYSFVSHICVGGQFFTTDGQKDKLFSFYPY